MTGKPIIVQSEHLADEAVRWLHERCDLRAVAYDAPEFPDVLAHAHALIVRTYTKVDHAMLENAPVLRVVGRAGTGLDNIDVAACRARGIQVVYAPQANTQAVVEYVIQLICDSIRPRVTLDQPVGAGEWRRLRSEIVGRNQFSDLTVGVLGLGRIGRRVAQVAAAIGADVLFNDLLDIPPELRSGAEPVPVEDLFRHAHVVSVHIDARTGNRHFVGSWYIDRMRRDVIFINTSRGFVVDNVALAQFLRAHPEALAHLDVHDPEPFDDSYPLLGLPNARLYPHLAGRTDTALSNMSWVVRDVIAVLEGASPRFPAPHVDIAPEFT